MKKNDFRVIHNPYGTDYILIDAFSPITHYFPHQHGYNVMVIVRSQEELEYAAEKIKGAMAFNKENTLNRFKMIETLNHENASQVPWPEAFAHLCKSETGAVKLTAYKGQPKDDNIS